MSFKDIAFFNFRDGLGVNVIRWRGLKVGPVLKPALNREESGFNPFRIAGRKTEALRGLGDVDFGLELGGFAEYSIDQFSLRSELRRGIGSHNSWVGEGSLKYSDIYFGLGPPIICGVGPQLQFATSKFARTYWGINSTQASRSGLNQYNPRAGIISYGIRLFAILPLVGELTAVTFFGYDRLAPDLSKSPLVNKRGSPNQFSGGMGISYKMVLID